MIIWLMERCLRRRDRCSQRERYNLYNERIQILDNLFQGLTRGDQESRQRAMQMLGNMTDISEDEESPNYGHLNTQEGQRETQRAADFVHHLRRTPTLSSSSGHVDRVADELHAMIDEMAEEEAPSDDLEVAETRSQRIQRYQDSELCEVSDPELWMDTPLTLTTMVHSGDSAASPKLWMRQFCIGRPEDNSDLW